MCTILSRCRLQSPLPPFSSVSGHFSSAGDRGREGGRVFHSRGKWELSLACSIIEASIGAGVCGGKGGGGGGGVGGGGV